MLRSTKNRLLEVVKSHADPILFDGVEEKRGNQDAFVISAKGTPLEFFVRNPPTSFREFDCAYTRFVPGFPLSPFVPAAGYTADLELIASELKEWLTEHALPCLEEVSQPDLWERLEDERALFGTASVQPADMGSFTADEKARARAALLQFERRIQLAFNPSPEQAEVIAAQMQYLSAAVDRLNHFDWRSLLLSTVIGVATTLSLDTDAGRELFEIAKQVFSEALKYLPG